MLVIVTVTVASAAIVIDTLSAAGFGLTSNEAASTISSFSVRHKVVKAWSGK